MKGFQKKLLIALQTIGYVPTVCAMAFANPVYWLLTGKNISIPQWIKTHQIAYCK